MVKTVSCMEFECIKKSIIGKKCLDNFYFKKSYQSFKKFIKKKLAIDFPKKKKQKKRLSFAKKSVQKRKTKKKGTQKHFFYLFIKEAFRGLKNEIGLCSQTGPWIYSH